MPVQTTMMTTADPSFDLRHTLTRPSPTRTVSPARTDHMDVDPSRPAPILKDITIDGPSPHSEPSTASRSNIRHRIDTSREREREREGERERERERDKDKDKDKERERDRERERERERDRRYRDASRDHDHDRDRRRRHRDDYDDYYGDDRYPSTSSSSRSRRGYEDYDRDRRYDDERRRDRYHRRRLTPPPRDRQRDDSRNGLNRPAPVPDLPQTERDQRTVFVAQLHLQARPTDIADFFEKLDTGAVRDVKLVADRGSRRGKGVGFVEFYELESVDKALALAGQLLLGVPIIVERTEAEKNRLALAAAAEKSKLLAQANAAAAVQGMRHLTTSTSPGTTSASNTPRSLAKGIASLPPRPSFMADKFESVSKTLCVDKLPVNLTSSDIRQIFEPFGPVTNVHLTTDHHAKSTGTAHVSFTDVDACQNALSGLKGFVIGEHEIVCSLFVEQVFAAQGGGEPEELEEKAGVRLNAQSRVELMAKLARAKNVPVPTLSIGPGATTINASSNEDSLSTLNLSANTTATTAGVSSVAHATRCLLLTNMFDPTQETEPDWDRDIELDVKSECERQYGPVRHIHLIKDSSGLVFLKFSSIDACSRALTHLNGRLFAGNRISASYVLEAEYNTKFPDAAAV